MKNILEKLNWAFLMSRRACNGPPPSSYRKTLLSLFKTSMNTQENISNGLDTKLDSVIRSMNQTNMFSGSTSIETLQDLVNSAAIGNREEIQQTDTKIPATTSRKDVS